MSKDYLTDIQTVVSREEFFRVSGFSDEIFEELLEIGVFDALEVDKNYYSLRSIQVARTAARLGGTFELDVSAIALIIHYLEQIERLQEEVRHLKCVRAY